MVQARGDGDARARARRGRPRPQSTAVQLSGARRMVEELVAAAGPAAPPLVSVVVPVYNKRAFLRASLDSIVAASKRAGRVQLIFVDHSSTDGSYEILGEYGNDADVQRLEGGNISTVRNTGATSARGAYLSFIDCDCVVPIDYFVDLRAVFESSRADAVGCEVGIPESATWSERLWYELHVVRTDGP